jgi:hypothetical protein
MPRYDLKTLLPIRRKNWSIYRVDALRTDATPQRINGGLEQPERLSVFPDGRLLISYALNFAVPEPRTRQYRRLFTPPAVLNPQTRQIQPFALPVLRDPDFPQSPPLLPAIW